MRQMEMIYNTNDNNNYYLKKETMKKLSILLIGLVTMIMVSCSKDNDDYTQINDRYYVRYDVTLSSSYIGTMTVNVNTEKGAQTFQTSSKIFSETFGPVDKGFKASVSASHDLYYGVLYSSIYVCKGDEPFALKATGASSAEYTIDF